MRFSKCQNCQDRKIPIAKVDAAGDFGIGMAVDVEGNCRFYDLIRFKKMVKLSTSQAKIDNLKVLSTKFRLLQNQCVDMTQDAFFAVVQTPEIFRDEIKERAEKVKAASAAAEAAQTKDKKKEAATPIEEVSQEIELDPFCSESEVLADKRYSDDKAKLKSVQDIVYQDVKHNANYFTQKSLVSIYRYEDVIFSIFPHLAAQKRRGASTMEIFLNNDPFTKQNANINPIDQAALAQASQGLDAVSERDNNRVIDARMGSRDQSNIQDHQSMNSGGHGANTTSLDSKLHILFYDL